MLYYFIFKFIFNFIFTSVLPRKELRLGFPSSKVQGIPVGCSYNSLVVPALKLPDIPTGYSYSFAGVPQAGFRPPEALPTTPCETNASLRAIGKNVQILEKKSIFKKVGHSKKSVLVGTIGKNVKFRKSLIFKKKKRDIGKIRR